MTVSRFCRWVGFVVWFKSFFMQPLSPYVDARQKDCLITQTGASELTFIVQASDGRLYDSFALQRWLKCCVAKKRETSVIPGDPITSVKTVRTVDFTLDVHAWARGLVRRLSAWAARHRPSHRAKSTADAETQTTQHCPAQKRVSRRLVTSGTATRIPGPGSAFTPVVPRRTTSWK